MSPPRYMASEADLQPAHAAKRRQFSIKPVIVPQVTPVWSSPFVRGYSEQLVRQYNISPERWIAFIDGLNQLIAKNAPLAVVKTAATVAGFFPSAIVAGAATGVQVLAGVGDAVRAKQLVTSYIVKANKQFFAPLGLFCKIYDTKAALQLLGLPANAVAAAGATMDEMLVQARACAVGQTQDVGPTSVDIAFRPFGDAVSPIVLVQQQDPQVNSGVMSSMNNWSVRRETKKNNKEARKKAEKLVEEHQKGKKQKDIYKAAKEYAAATGQSIQGFEPEKKKLGGGSTLWIVVLPLAESPDAPTQQQHTGEKDSEVMNY